MGNFTKYHRLGGAYHWDPVKAGPEYMNHANKVAQWMDEDGIKSVLDIGAGDGFITHKMRQFGIEVLGIDNEPYAVELAQEKDQPVIEGDIYMLPWEAVKRKWDAIYLGDIIEHLKEPERAIQLISKLSDIIYISTPPRKPSGELMSQHHEFEFTPDELEQFMNNLGFTQTRCEVDNGRIFARFVK